ncbi:MAG: pyridoxal phosphate-dependent aminotransferase [Planctomycetota bacterium]|nr:pyridoxal phosphate-dependent aminotransferase [Planctomycetota bacterium]
MPISKALSDSLSRSSWIRKMFEEGNRLKSIHGEDEVFDFTLGNPHLAPPQQLIDRLRELTNGPQEEIHRYMPNAGWPEVREKIADDLKRRNPLPWSGSHIVMTVGAGGALNILLKTLLNPGDEVIILSPYFVEYIFYIQNHGGIVVDCPTNENFCPEPEALLSKITNRTRAVIINSPNNPTGRVYNEVELTQFSEGLREASSRIGHPIYLISDEPYRKITYGNVVCPEIVNFYDDTVVITSHSKDLGLAGDRIGYLAVSPKAADCPDIVAGCTFSNRTLGFVNAPSILQLAIADCQEVTVDCEEYARNLQVLSAQLEQLGFDFIQPGGAFFLFPTAPGNDDVEFVQTAMEEKILVVPGSGFGRAGHFRLSFAIPEELVTKSLPAWERLAERCPTLGRDEERTLD